MIIKMGLAVGSPVGPMQNVGPKFFEGIKLKPYAFVKKVTLEIRIAEKAVMNTWVYQIV